MFHSLCDDFFRLSIAFDENQDCLHQRALCKATQLPLRTHGVAAAPSIASDFVCAEFYYKFFFVQVVSSMLFHLILIRGNATHKYQRVKRNFAAMQNGYRLSDD
jgi:hypothetical protein